MKKLLQALRNSMLLLIALFITSDINALTVKNSPDSASDIWISYAATSIVGARKSDYTRVKVGERYTVLGSYVKPILTVRAYHCVGGLPKAAEKKFKIKELSKKMVTEFFEDLVVTASAGGTITAKRGEEPLETV